MEVEKITDNVGKGLYKPNERGKVTIETECRLDNSEGEVQIPWAAYKLVLGQPEERLWEAIENCVVEMKEDEENEYYFRSKKSVEPLTYWCKIRLVSFERATDSWKLGPEEKFDIATRYKTKGNELYRANKIGLAGSQYSKAIRMLITIGPVESPELTAHILELRIASLSNLATCRMKANQFHLAAECCSKVLKDDPEHVKCLFRRGQAHMELNDFDLAKSDLLKAKKLDPTNPSIDSTLKKLQTKIEAKNTYYHNALKKMFNS